MEKQKLPDEIAVMLLGLLSFVGCCCTNGFGGIILSGVGIYLAQKSEKLLITYPDVYKMGDMKAWKIVNYVGLAISIVYALLYIFLKVTGLDETILEMQEEMIRRYER